MTDKQLDFFGNVAGLPSGVTVQDDGEVTRTVEVICAAYHAGVFGGTVHEVFPDIDRQSLHWRIYFTLPCAINYQRKSENLWSSALATFQDPETNFVFNCANTYRGIQAYKSALTKHKLALQPEKQSLIWFTISDTLYRHHQGDPLVLFEKNSNNVQKIKEHIVANKKMFPYVSGPKLLNYWLYIFSYFNSGIPLVRKDQISVIPDVHVKKATVMLGLMSEEQAADTNAVAARWESLLRGTQFAPCDVHAPLWRWSRAGFPSKSSLTRALES
jgi:hypothetical protein